MPLLFRSLGHSILMCEICRYQPLCPAVANFFGFEEAAMRRRKRIEEVAAITAAVGIEARPHWGGSVPGHIVQFRNHEVAHQELCRRYFDVNLMFDEHIFQRR
jgi:hypothetical protein